MVLYSSHPERMLVMGGIQTDVNGILSVAVAVAVGVVDDIIFKRRL